MKLNLLQELVATELSPEWNTTGIRDRGYLQPRRPIVQLIFPATGTGVDFRDELSEVIAELVKIREARNHLYSPEAIKDLAVCLPSVTYHCMPDEIAVETRTV